MAEVESKTDWKKGFKLGFWILVVAGGLIFYANYRKNKSKIVGFEITGNSLLPRQELVQVLDSLRGRSVADISLAEVRSQLKTNPFIKEVYLSIASDNTLWVTIQEQTPLALEVFVDGTSKYVGYSGELLPSQTFASIPDVPLFQNFTQTIERFLAVKFLQTLTKDEWTRRIISECRWNVTSASIDIELSSGMIVKALTIGKTELFSRRCDREAFDREWETKSSEVAMLLKNMASDKNVTGTLDFRWNGLVTVKQTTYDPK